MELPIYNVVVDENNPLLGMDFNSFVSRPAHDSTFIKFSKEKQSYSIDEDKRTVTGVMIWANKKIYRNEPEPCYYVFTPETIKVIQRKFMKNGYTQNLNLQHSEPTNGAILTDIYIASNSDDRFPNIPQALSDQGIEDGSLIASYYIEDDSLWERVKNGEFSGFSIEIWSDIVKVSNYQKQNKMDKPRKSLWELTKEALGISDKVVYSEAKSVDGATFYYDGEIGEGTAIYSDSEMTTPLASGVYQVTLSDESIKIITVSETGTVVEIDDFVEDEEETIEEIQEAFTSLTAEYKSLKEKFEAKDSEIESLKAKVAELDALNKAGKFTNQPKAGEQTAGKTARELFKNRKTK